MYRTAGVGKIFGVEGRMSPWWTCCGLDRLPDSTLFANTGTVVFSSGWFQC